AYDRVSSQRRIRRRAALNTQSRPVRHCECWRGAPVVTKKQSLLAQEGLGVHTDSGGNSQELEAIFAIWDNSRQRLVVHMGKLCGTAWTKRHHGDESGLAEALTCNGHLLTSPPFFRLD